MKKLLLVMAALLLFTACPSEADTVSHNLSKEADRFRVIRRIVFYNGINGDYILTVEGRCSLGNYDDADELSVTCRTGKNEYKKHFLGLSDNVTYFAEQLEAKNISRYHYKVIFRPKTIVPDVDLDNEAE